MLLTPKQATGIKNLAAFFFCNVDSDVFGKDRDAWKAADIPSRETLTEFIKQIRKMPDSSKVVLPVMVARDLKKVIAYLYDDELKHFEESEPEEQRGHIWQSVCRLENFLNGWRAK